MTEKLKAWIVGDDDWSELLHAETRGKARSEAAGLFTEFGSYGDTFLCMRATRFPRADGRAFDISDRWAVDGEGEHYDNYISECDCAYCNPKPIEVRNE